MKNIKLVVAVLYSKLSILILYWLYERKPKQRNPD